MYKSEKETADHVIDLIDNIINSVPGKTSKSNIEMELNLIDNLLNDSTLANNVNNNLTVIEHLSEIDDNVINVEERGNEIQEYVTIDHAINDENIIDHILDNNNSSEEPYVNSDNSVYKTQHTEIDEINQNSSDNDVIQESHNNSVNHESQNNSVNHESQNNIGSTVNEKSCEMNVNDSNEKYENCKRLFDTDNNESNQNSGIFSDIIETYSDSKLPKTIDSVAELSVINSSNNAEISAVSHENKNPIHINITNIDKKKINKKPRIPIIYRDQKNISESVTNRDGIVIDMVEFVIYIMDIINYLVSPIQNWMTILWNLFIPKN